MTRSEIEFTSEGATCRGFFQTPDDAEPPYPTVVLGGGWCYVKEIVLPTYADRFAEEGMACLAFDYRNLGESDVVDEPQHLDPWKQIRDYQNAITYVEERDDVDGRRIGVFGISYSGGHSLILSAIEDRVDCAVSVLPVVDGYENQRRVHGEENFYQLQEWIKEDRRNRVDGERDTIPMAKPPDADFVPREAGTWPFEETYEVFMDLKENQAPRHEHWSTLESVELLLNYTVFPYVRRNLYTPTKVIVAENDDITLWDLEKEAYRELRTEEKELFVVPEASHMTLYSEESLLEIAAEEGARWYREYFIDRFER